MNKKWNRWRKRILCLAATLSALTVSTLAAGLPSANTLEGSKLITGTKSLVADTTGVLMWACPAVATIAVIYLFIRRSMADEQDGKLWQKRIVIAIICGVAGCLASTFINVISKYY